jgi:hypothetical protein
VDSKEPASPTSIGQDSVKKTYQKPRIQVFGTLSEMTQAVDGHVGHKKDFGSNVAGTAAHNRT